MAKRKSKRRRSTSETIFIIFGLIIALSMILSLVVGLGSRGRSSNAPLPPDFPAEELGEPIGSVDGGSPAAIAAVLPGAAAPPFS